MPTIYYNPKLIDNESIAHELLHIKMEKHHFFIGNHIYLSAQHNKKLKRIFSKKLCDFIENLFEHNKIFPAYIKLGYEPESFLQDGTKLKCAIKDAKFLNKHIQKSSLSGKLINLYIGKNYVFVIAGKNHICVVTPFRKQITKINNEFYKLDSEMELPVVDTVERIQGQSVEVVIISYVVSDPDYVEDVSDFILSTNRINVAISRAKTKVIFLCSEAIFEGFPKSYSLLRNQQYLEQKKQEAFIIDYSHQTDVTTSS